jgi:antitoxin (DNA-binding transcriptional repressor) of toxin-antitoxin stability system
MNRKVRIGELKAKLSEHLRYVKRGGTITVLDRDQPIAKITPHRPTTEKLVVVQPAAGKIPWNRIPLPPPLKTDIDIVELLLEDRYSRR